MSRVEKQRPGAAVRCRGIRAELRRHESDRHDNRDGDHQSFKIDGQVT